LPPPVLEPPILTPPPPLSSQPPPPGGFRRKALGLPVWAWLLVVVALAGGGAAYALTRNGDDKSAKVASTEATEVADTTETTATTPGTPAPTAATTEPTAVTTAPPTTTPETEPATVAPTVVTTPSGDGATVPGAPAGVSGDRTNPVPAGTIADIGGGWRLQVLAVNPDAAAAITAANQFNEPPPDGSTFTMVTVALGYFGLTDPTSGYMTTISAVGAANVELTSGCGVLPQELDSFSDLFSGGVLIGNICFVTTPADAANLQLYASGDIFGSNQVFLDARSNPAAAVPMTGLVGPQPGAASTPKRLAPTPLLGAADIGEGWKMAVGGAARDITDAVMAENSFNSPPPDGYRFIGVDVTYAFNGSGSSSPFMVTVKAVGASNVMLGSDCGVIPGAMDVTADVFAGGTVSGTICFVAPAADPAMTLYATASFSGDYTMFATT
jgi:hypothetical protein